MARYPQRLEEKFAWMRERMRQRESRESARLSKAAHKRHERLRAERPAHLEMYRLKEVAEMLGVSTRTVGRWFRGRAIAVGNPASKGRRARNVVLISRRTLEEWLKERQLTR